MTAGLSVARLAAATTATALYLLLLGATAWRVRQRNRQLAEKAATLATKSGEAGTWLVAHASQTGAAEDLAWQTANALHTAGLAAQLTGMAQLDADALRHASRVLFIVSTYGEGDPPDSGAVFAQRVMSAPLPLGHLHFGMLALGDRSYRHFCGFGRALDAWLQAQGAVPWFARVEASNLDPAAITRWRHQLSHLAGTDDLPDWQAPRFDDWHLVRRELLNPGSAGAPLYDLRLEPAGDTVLPHWEAGDLAQIAPPADAARPREYSIASLPAEGHLRLLVRLERRADDTQGLCSGWLCGGLPENAALPLRVRAHGNFRLGANAARPLILIGNGTGLAGLRAHLKARSAHSGTRNWLLFGERQAQYDALYDAELRGWEQAGVLTRLDRVWSRDSPQRRYVQDRLRECAAELRRWIDDGAAIYVCGSLEGMASGVESALNDLLGTGAMTELAAAGRYRRDVYQGSLHLFGISLLQTVTIRT